MTTRDSSLAMLQAGPRRLDDNELDRILGGGALSCDAAAAVARAYRSAAGAMRAVGDQMTGASFDGTANAYDSATCTGPIALKPFPV